MIVLIEVKSHYYLQLIHKSINKINGARTYNSMWMYHKRRLQRVRDTVCRGRRSQRLPFTQTPSKKKTNVNRCSPRKVPRESVTYSQLGFRVCTVFFPVLFGADPRTRGRLDAACGWMIKKEHPISGRNTPKRQQISPTSRTKIIHHVT